MPGLKSSTHGVYFSTVSSCQHSNATGHKCMVWPDKLSKINYSRAMLTKVNAEQQPLESPPVEGQARASSAHTGLGEL